MRRIVFIAYFLTSLSFLAIVGKVGAQNNSFNGKGLSKYRLGFGIGNSFLTTKEMDFRITRFSKGINELEPSAIISVQKLMRNNSAELGLVLRHGDMQTLLSSPLLTARCIYDELQVNFQKSLNNNAGLNRGRFTYNLVVGAGIINFKSKFSFILIDSNNKKVTLSSVGYPRTDWDVYQLKRQNSFIGSLGFAIGCRITKHFSLYWENSFNLSSSTKMKGSLSPERGGFADGYLFSSIGLYLRLQPINKLRCPRFK